MLCPPHLRSISNCVICLGTGSGLNVCLLFLFFLSPLWKLRRMGTFLPPMHCNAGRLTGFATNPLWSPGTWDDMIFTLWGFLGLSDALDVGCFNQHTDTLHWCLISLVFEIPLISLAFQAGTAKILSCPTPTKENTKLAL